MALARTLLIPAYLFLCVLLGGATLAGYLSNMVLQLLALPIIVASLMAVRRTPMPPSARSLLILTAAMIALVLIQLIPLPPSIWTALPGRERIVAGFELLGQPLPWMPISLAREQTLATLLWLLPAFAVLLGIVRLGAFSAFWLAASIVLVGIVSVGLGTLQVSGGRTFYLYNVTNYGKAVGFFANANHQATLLLVAIPFLAALFAARPRQSRGRRSRASRRSTGVLLAGSVLAVFAGGLLINRSLAGWGLALPVAGASFMLIWNAAPKVQRLGFGVLGLAVIGAVALIFLDPLGTTMSSEAERGSAQSRYTSITTTLDAGVDHLPLGSGIGTFPEIYRSYEDPNTVVGTWMNHAHSDYAELFLETGVPGIVLLLIFLIWWFRRVLVAWSENGDLYARAASIASAAILAHSLVDYPVRSAAISAMFAACCALLTVPRERGEARRVSRDSDKPRHLAA
jgi:O-antigen ligase